MDPISQGAVGAVAALIPSKNEEVRKATILGWVGGMLADADILIRTANNPLLTIEYHRHFTHSLLFIPIGGLIAALLFWPFIQYRLPALRIYLFTTLGYATAGLLDACTSYGTRLFWPFTQERVAWNIISIIDPIFTLTLLILIAFAYFKRKKLFSIFAALFVIAYLNFGLQQRDRADMYLRFLAEHLGHKEIEQVSVKPSIGNLFLWRGIYRYKDRFYTNAIRVVGSKVPKIYTGTSLPIWNKEKFKERIPENSILAQDIDRFDHFSNGYLTPHPNKPNYVCDFRYSMIPNSIDPLWGIKVDPSKPDEHVPFENFRSMRKEKLDLFFKMLFSKL